MSLQTRWVSVCKQLGIDTDLAMFLKLKNSYTEPQRHYHTLQHLEECLSYFDRVKDQMNNPREVEVALWFHDCVYDVKSKQNEKKSAEYAVKWMKEKKISTQSIICIQQLILITDHQTKPQNNDEKLIVDIDLAILGAKPLRFLEYNQQIRKEYSWVDDSLYKQTRNDILRCFLEQSTIYQTPYFFEHFEKQARINLQNIIT